MEYRDINDDSIEQGFYRETFYKGNDILRNRNIQIIKFKGFKGLYTIADESAPVRLNPTYSQWLRPFNYKELKKKLEDRLFASCPQEPKPKHKPHKMHS